MNEEKEIDRYECPRCGKQEYVTRFGWRTITRPCPSQDDCIKHLRERLEEIERRLDAHNF